MRLFPLLLAVSGVNAQEEAAPEAAAEEAPVEETEEWQREGWGWGGLPAVAYNSDDGLGGGVVGNIYRYDGMTAPYKMELYFLFYVTTKQVHTHRVQMALLEVGGQP